jgi:hypothetical protein
MVRLMGVLPCKRGEWRTFITYHSNNPELTQRVRIQLDALHEAVDILLFQIMEQDS